MTFRQPETEENRLAERRARNLLEWFWDATTEKIEAVGYHPDFLVHRDGKLIAVCEFKERSNRLLRYPTSNICKKKFYTCLTMAQELGVPFVYLAKFTNGLYYYACTDDSEITDEGVWGRTDRGDPFDQSEAIGMPSKLFKAIRFKL